MVKQAVIPAKGHTEVIDDAKAPTCTDAGKTEGKHCSVCNKVIVEQEEIEALGHSYTSTVTKPATEEEEGIRTYTCSRCDDTYTDVIPKLPAGHVHDYVKTVLTEPSCLQDGVNKFVCEGCGDEYTEPSPALGHTEVVDEAT